jgi:isopentenyl diphosphate isomerase/L-lactate dehydrogenase-like FMN-dependent dehydrogenase
MILKGILDPDAKRAVQTSIDGISGFKPWRQAAR